MFKTTSTNYKDSRIGLCTRIRFLFQDAVLFTAVTACALLYLQVHVNGLHSLLTKVDNEEVNSTQVSISPSCCQGDALTAYLDAQEHRLERKTKR